MRVGQYVIYNTGEDPVFIQKGETLGYCSLIYQDMVEDYLNEMGHMAREAKVDKEEWKDLKTKSKRRLTSQLGGHKPTLSVDWIKDAFKLSDNATLKDKPKLMNQLIKVLASHGPAFEGGPHRAQEAGQVGAGRTHWVTARVELRDDNRGPAHVKQRRMHPHERGSTLQPASPVDQTRSRGTMRKSVELSPHRGVQERLLTETILPGPETTQQTMQEVVGVPGFY